MNVLEVIRAWYGVERRRLFGSRLREMQARLDAHRKATAAQIEMNEELRAEIADLEARLADKGGGDVPQLSLPMLSPAELERVAILADQCGQLVQICGKILRNGYEGCSPFDIRSKPNRMLLEREVGAMRGVLDLMLDRGDIHWSEIAVYRKRKRSSLAQWTHYQGFSAQAVGGRAGEVAQVGGEQCAVGEPAAEEQHVQGER